FCFFFSSRRRHTRSKRDWSSDVCSSDLTGERKLYRVWFCKSRLCPMCNWRRAMKHGIQSQKVVAEVIRREPKVRWLFLTLSVKNVYDGEERSEERRVGKEWRCGLWRESG